MPEAIKSGLAQPEVDEFEIMRRRVQQQGQAREEAAKKGARQQFARLGNFNSGAAIKVENQQAQEQRQQTDQSVQDVNILQSQQLRQADESRQNRELQKFGIQEQVAAQRFGIEQQAAVQREGFGVQKEMQQIQIAANLDELSKSQAYQTVQNSLDRDQQTKLSNMSINAQKDIAANQLAFDELGLNENIRQFNDSIKFQELDAGVKNQLLQDQQDLAKKTYELQETLQKHAIDQDNSELAVNKMVTAVNMVGLLKESGFSNADIAGVFEALDLGEKADTFLKYLNGISEATEAVEAVIGKSAATNTAPAAPTGQIGPTGSQNNSNIQAAASRTASNQASASTDYTINPGAQGYNGKPATVTARGRGGIRTPAGEGALGSRTRSV